MKKYDLKIALRTIGLIEQTSKEMGNTDKAISTIKATLEWYLEKPREESTKEPKTKEEKKREDIYA